MSFFEDKLFEFVEELGSVGVGGHEKVDTEEKQVCEKRGSVFEASLGEFDLEIKESPSGDDFSSGRSPSRLDLGGNTAKWRRARLFLIDLMDYSIERNGAENLEIWRKMDEWEFEGKLVWKNLSYLRLNRFSWDEAV